MVMPKWLWVLFVIFISIGVLLLWQKGLGPRPIRHMSVSNFEKASDIGVIVYRKLLPFLRESQFWAIGSLQTTAEVEEVIAGLVKMAQADQKSVEFSSPQLIENAEEFSALIGAKTTTKQIFISRAQNFSSLYSSNWLNLLREQKQTVILPLVLTILPLAIHSEELEHIEPKCPQGAQGLSGLDFFGCKINEASRHTFRKKLPLDKLYSALDQIGPREFILYVHPKQTSHEPSGDAGP